MPCNDVTESLRVDLDTDDRLESYRLIKRTCGRSVGGETMLQERLHGTPADAILAIVADDFIDFEGDETEAFLSLKHLFALQAGIGAFLGTEPAGPGEPVRLAAIGYDETGAHFEAEISVDLLTERIKGCGKCKGCGVLHKV